ncbi:hypothetical protein GCK72_004541 [Caenorhabditis remanei]|uniref:Uncharacterized protein n=1 Tax=Caenorhabditis remanei TaxID=31234 RepID=A0A6A5HE58_CAERE|nr:hypothetical protein GCK72_004541 [Caenorhabditis remanei]KAF1764592.1 hypothetical protein GCK72_004541 [Caenorhabditis remanei]
MAEQEEDGLKSKDDAEKSVVPVIPKTSEDNIVEKDEKKIGEKCAAKSSKKENVEKCEFWNFWVLGRSGTGRSEITVDFETPHTFSAPKSVVSCETPSKNERRRKKRIEKGNLGGRKVFKTDGNSRGAPKGPRKGKVNKTNRRGQSSPEPPKIPFLLEISPEKLVVPPLEPLKVTVRNPTEDTQTLRCTFDSYYFLVDFNDAKSSRQQGVTPAAAYGCYELGPGESCSLTNIIDIVFYNHKRPEGFLKFEYRKKEKRTNAKWVVRKQQLHLTDDIQEMIRLEDEKSKEKAKGNEGTHENETATDPNPPENMKFYRMKWLHNATQSHQKWRASWGEQLRNDDDGTHRVFSVQPDFVVDQFVRNNENYNQTLGTEKDNLAFWKRIFVTRNIRNYECKIAILDRNAGFGKHDFTAETLEESLEKAEKFLEDQRKEDSKNYNLHIEQVRMEREIEQKNKKEKEDLEKEEEFKKELEMVQPVKQKEEKKVEKKEENKEEQKKKKNPCCSIL